MSTLVLRNDGLQNLGFYILAVLYFSICVSSVMSTALLKKLGVYKCLVFGGLGHFSFVFANIFPAIKYDHPDSESVATSQGFITGMLIVCAIVNGLGAAMIWVANGNYISQCATPSTKGLFYGFFWIVYMMSQVVGSLIGAAILKSGKDQTFFYLSLAILAAAASLSFVFIRKPLVLEEVSDQPMVLHAHQLSHVQDYMTQADESSYLDKSTQSGIRLTRSTADEKKLGKSVSYDKGRDLIES